MITEPGNLIPEVTCEVIEAEEEDLTFKPQENHVSPKREEDKELSINHMEIIQEVDKNLENSHNQANEENRDKVIQEPCIVEVQGTPSVPSSHYTTQDSLDQEIPLNNAELDEIPQPRATFRTPQDDDPSLLDSTTLNSFVSHHNDIAKDQTTATSQSSSLSQPNHQPTSNGVHQTQCNKAFQVKDIDGDNFLKILQAAKETKNKYLKIRDVMQFNGGQFEDYLYYKNPEVEIDKFEESVLIELQKPLTLEIKPKVKKSELKRQEKEKKKKEKEEMLKQLNQQGGEGGRQMKRIKFFADEYGDGTGLEPWWFQNKKEKLFEIINDYKYPLQKMLTQDQILNMRKMEGKIPNQREQLANYKEEKAYTRCDVKTMKQRKELKQQPEVVRQSSRPRRQAAQNAQNQIGQQSREHEDSFRVMNSGKNLHELVECQRYFSERNQPIVVFITIEALILMTVHSHIHRNEIIGFLSGLRLKTKRQENIILIQDSLPCQTSEINDGKNVDYSRNVEMNYESAWNRIKEIEQKGQSLLGWYHSHPKFEVNPSHIDVYNHEMYQKMFNEQNKTFFGIIISPYYSTTDTHQKHNSLPKLRCFLNQLNKDSNSIVPYEIAINILPQCKLYKEQLFKEIIELKDEPFSNDKINLRAETCILKCKKNQQFHIRKGEKLIRSLKQILEMNIDKLRAKISTCFLVKGIEGVCMLKQKVENPSLQNLQKVLPSLQNGENNSEEEDQPKNQENVQEEEKEEEQKFMHINLNTLCTIDEVHNNMCLTMARIMSKYFREKDWTQLEDQFMNIAKLGQADKVIEEIRDIFQLDDDSFFSEEENPYESNTVKSKKVEKLQKEIQEKPEAKCEVIE